MPFVGQPYHKSNSDYAIQDCLNPDFQASDSVEFPASDVKQ